MNFKEWFNRVVLNRKPEPVAAPEPYLGPDELAEKLATEANDLFAVAHQKRLEAAQTLEQAADTATRQADALVQQAEQLRDLAKGRVEKAATNLNVAKKLSDFLS